METAVFAEKPKAEFLAAEPLAARPRKDGRREVEPEASKICQIDKSRFDALVKFVKSNPAKISEVLDVLDAYPQVKLDEKFPQSLSEAQKAEFVMELVRGRALGINYESEREGNKLRPPRTAAETLDKRKGNCVELSLLYIALAEQMGLKNIAMMNMHWKTDDGTEEVHEAVVVKTGDGCIIADPANAIFLHMKVNIAIKDIPKHWGIIHGYEEEVTRIYRKHSKPGIEENTMTISIVSSLSQVPAQYWSNAAAFYASSEQYNDAAVWAEKAYYSNREFPPLRKNLLAIYRLAESSYHKKGDYKNAAEVLEKYLKIERNDAEVYNQLGNDYVMLGEREKAIDAFKEVIKREPLYSLLYWHAEFNIAKLETVGLLK